jgi:hypothetical protein
MGFLVQGGAPPDNSVSTSKVQNNAIDETKLKDALVADFTEVTVVAGDSILLGDANDSGNTKRDTVQGILDLAGGGLEFVSTASISAATTLAITGLAAGYDYIITLEAFSPTDDSEAIWMRWSDDGGSSYEAGSTDYHWDVTRAGNDDTDVADTEIQISGVDTLGNDANTTSTLEITLVNPNASSEQTTAFWQGFILEGSSPNAMSNITGSARFTQGTDEVDAVQFLWSGGSTFKAQGDITVRRRTRS